MLNEIPVQAPDGQPFRLLTLRNDAGMVVTLMDWGATLLSARIPLSDGSVREALLAAPVRNNTRNRLHFWGLRLAATRTVSPTAAIPLLAKPLNYCQVRAITNCTADQTVSTNVAGR